MEEVRAVVEEGSTCREARSPRGLTAPTCDLMGRSWEGTVGIRTTAWHFQCLGFKAVSSKSNTVVTPVASLPLEHKYATAALSAGGWAARIFTTRNT